MAKREMTTHELADFLEKFANLLKNRPDMMVSTLMDIINYASTSNIRNEVKESENSQVRHRIRIRPSEVPLVLVDEPIEGFSGVPKSELISLIENYQIPVKWSKSDSTKLLARKLRNYLDEHPEMARRLETPSLAHALRLLRSIK